jgi:4-methylaminobutanoate oxidase (formaldehyde-forming)
VTVTDVSAMQSVLSVMGPQALALMQRVSPDDLTPQGLKFSTTREIDLGLARVRAVRMSYVGGPGYELYVPIEMARHVYLALHEAGADLNFTDAGYYAIDALRIEAGRRAWGAEIGPDETPWEAGLGFAVKLDKPAGFVGREALLKAQGQPLRKKLVNLVLDDPSVWIWGGEPLLLNGEPAGELASAGWSPAAGRGVALAYLRGEIANRPHAGTPVTIDLFGEPVSATAWDEPVLQRARRTDRSR